MSQQTGQGAPPYSEKQVTRWLSFLARAMTEHDQTIFLIENLQPSWFPKRTQCLSYIFASRLIWGAVSGLVFGLGYGLIDKLVGGLFFGLIDGLAGGLSVGLIGGLFAGLIGGLVDIIRFVGYRLSQPQNKPRLTYLIIGGSVLGLLIGGLFGALIGYLSDGLIFGVTGKWSYDLFNGLTFGLAYGLISGSIWAMRSLGRTFSNEIRTVEMIRFSWTSIPRSLMSGMIVGMIVGLIVGLIFELVGRRLVGLGDALFARLTEGLGDAWLARLTVGLGDGMRDGATSGLFYVLFYVFIFGLVFGLAGALANSFQPIVRDMKTAPNQGIRLSLRSAGLMGSIGSLVSGLIVGLLSRDWTTGLTYGALGGLCIGLWYGGLDMIQHFLVRFLLWRAGCLPWDVARFLDYAAEELHFLQKVGGGYIFVHRYLLEHFAAMEGERKL